MLKLRAAAGSFELEPKILNLLGCNKEKAVGILQSIGYQKTNIEITENGDDKLVFVASKNKRNKFIKKKRAQPKNFIKNNAQGSIDIIENSPFAKLKEMSIR
jgi:hypothetical protein